MEGPQIGIVVGPEGEEIYCDEYGRVRVWLSWDRHAERRRGDGAREEHASCWMRVAQNWAGAGWGHIAIPRIGQEVLVSYIDADCDQPIITSRTYNANNLPPYKLPEHKTRMSIKSKTHKGEGFNELRFEDEKGKEEVFIHAQRDRNEKTRNNHTERTDNNWVQSIGGFKASEVQKSVVEVVNVSKSLIVGSSPRAPHLDPRLQDSQGIASLATSTGLRSFHWPPSGCMRMHIEKDFDKNIGGVYSVESGVSYSLLSEKVDITSNKQMTFTSSVSTGINAKHSLSINGGDQVSISSGKARIILEKDGTIVMRGTQLLVEMDGQTEIKSGLDVEICASKIKLN